MAQLTTISPAEIEALVRYGNEDPDSYLKTVGSSVRVDEMDTEIRFHHVAHDATLNVPDFKKLADKLIGLLMDFACTRGEKDKALALTTATGSGEAFSRLHEKARHLFVTSDNSGEPGELLLYFLTERTLRFPQILCKFPHKTSTEMHTHGADGVHASLDPNTGHLRLHWGESKFVSRWSSALGDCLTSIVDLILQPTGAKKKTDRDIELLRDWVDLGNTNLEKAICDYLDPDKAQSNLIKYCGVCVIGFDADDYGELLSDDGAKMKELVQSCCKSIQKAVEKRKLEKIRLDFFCIPCSSVEAFKAAFIERLGT
jgi:hypothetical protein